MPSDADVLLELIRQHIESDTRQFAAQGTKLDDIASDVKSLLQSRSYGRGKWAGLALAGSSLLGVTGFLMHLWGK